MHLAELKLWNFRKYGIDGEEFETAKPGLTVKFNKVFNLLVGENDSGKTAIIDAIKHVLFTQSHDFISLESKDFFKPENGERTNILKIECIFRGFDSKEAANFLEWIGFEEVNGNQEYVLKVRLLAKHQNHRIIADVKAGPDEIGNQLDGLARDLLRVTYLKPLRNVESELTPGYRNRFAQILRNHKIFHRKKRDNEDNAHYLEIVVRKANERIKEFFFKDIIEVGNNRSITGAKTIMDILDGYLEKFFPPEKVPNASVKVAESDLNDILQKLSLNLEENKSGLGSLNMLFIATELLLLQNEENFGLKLALIEEIEAHLHPPAQLRLIKFLQKENDFKGQFILSTHSISLASSIDLENLIICKEDKIYPMNSKYTKLSKGDYKFLQRFLDATKANLFFARGVILVEGDSENILIPCIAEILDRPLYRYGISVVKVGSKELLRYSKIFLRKDVIANSMNIPVAIVTDLDIKPAIFYKDNKEDVQNNIPTEKIRKKKNIEEKYREGTVEVFVSQNWTLEYEIALSELKNYFYAAVYLAKRIRSNDDYYYNNEKEKNMQEVKVKKKVESWKGKSDEEIAYDIYKPLLKKKASKVVAAQCFSEILINNKKKVKSIIEKDLNWKYLRDAIYYVTSQPKEDDKY